MAAIDADGDGEISSAEIEKSVAALKTLDKNNDGKLTLDELRPANGPGQGRGGPFGEGPRGAGEGPGPGGPGAGGADAVARLMTFDKNGDGKLDAAELPERMQNIMARADADKDGVLTATELEQLNAAANNRRGGGGFGERGGRGGFEGRPNPEQMVQRALEFDADKNGTLSPEELGKMFGEMGMGMGMGGRGGRGGPGGPGGFGGGDAGRPRRPDGDQ
jgi:Ca2+-binding EF-hand superfamily protein